MHGRVASESGGLGADRAPQLLVEKVELILLSVLRGGIGFSRNDAIQHSADEPLELPRAGHLSVLQLSQDVQKKEALVSVSFHQLLQLLDSL